MKKELVIVIPAYEPNMLMIDLLHKLNQYFSACNILIVNDGSKREGVNKIFDLAKDIENVTILNHLVNKGKGAALKTAFKYIASLEECANYLKENVQSNDVVLTIGAGTVTKIGREMLK